jgi:hypothetical protein
MRIISLLSIRDRDRGTTRFLVCQHERSPPVEIPMADGPRAQAMNLRVLKADAQFEIRNDVAVAVETQVEAHHILIR